MLTGRVRAAGRAGSLKRIEPMTVHEAIKYKNMHCVQLSKVRPTFLLRDGFVSHEALPYLNTIFSYEVAIFIEGAVARGGRAGTAAAQLSGG
jgi:hypothetical protein